MATATVTKLNQHTGNLDITRTASKQTVTGSVNIKNALIKMPTDVHLGIQRAAQKKQPNC
eukprot:1954549-Amphidinium_carterae.1